MTGLRNGLRAIAPLLLVNWIAFAPLLSGHGLIIWVIGGSLFSAWASFTLWGAHRRMWSLLAVLVLTALIPLLADSLGGQSAGPIARASFMAVGTSGAMAILVQTRYPASAIVASLLLIAGALGLGSAEQGVWITLLWALSVMVSLALLGPYAPSFLSGRARIVHLGLAIALILGLVVGIQLATSLLITDPWTAGGVAAPRQDPTAIVAAFIAALGNAFTAANAGHLLMWAAGILALLLLASAFVLIVARCLVTYAWWRLRIKLKAGSTRQQVVGAWTWLRMQSLCNDRPLPLYVSPDVAHEWSRVVGSLEVLIVAEAVAPVAYGGDCKVRPETAKGAWQAARLTELSPSGSLAKRWRRSLRTPRWAQARLSRPV